MHKTSSGRRYSDQAQLSRRVGAELPLSRIYGVDLVANVSYGAATLAAMRVVDPTPAGAVALGLASIAYVVLLVLKIALVVFLQRPAAISGGRIGAGTPAAGPLASSRCNPVYVVSLLQGSAWALGLIGLGLADGGPCTFLLFTAPALFGAHWLAMDGFVAQGGPRQTHALDAFARGARLSRWRDRLARSETPSR